MTTEASNAASPNEARHGLVRERIDHVIVLMLENRSFDHMLGFLAHPYPDCFGQPDRTAYFNEDKCHVHYAASDDGTPDLVDPDHSPSGIRVQMGPYGSVPAMGGFVASYEERMSVEGAPHVMRCLSPDDKCPVLADLARKYAVCTRWFSSVPGETWPNRNFAHAATSDDAMTIEFGFYRDKTIFETLEQAGATWRIYYDGPPQVWFYKRLWKPRWRDMVPWAHPRLANWHEMPKFFDHVAKGDLPAYTFIEPAHNQLFSDPPRQTNSQHCHNNVKDMASTDFYAGEELIASVHDALLGNPDLFRRTLLIVTYDEHGGLYDHVVPPSSVDPNDPADVGIIRRLARWIRRKVDAYKGRPSNDIHDFSRLGVRVPTVLVSPWIPAGTVLRDVFDHASIPATLRALFAPTAKPLTARDACAATFHS